MAASGLFEVAWLCLVLLTCTILAGRLVDRIPLSPEADVWEKRLFAAGIGLGGLAGAMLLLGAVGLYYAWLIRSLFGAAVLVALIGRRRGRGKTEVFHPASWHWPDRAIVFLLAIGLGTYLLAALAPETGFDALNYHLGIPRLYIEHHGIYPTPHIVYSNFPLLGEMLFTFGWLVDSTILAKLFHFLFGLLTAAGIILLGRRYLSLRAGLLGALFFLASPIVGFLMQTAYVDLVVTFYVFLAVYASLNWLQGAADARGWPVLAGLAAGLAVGTKYSGVLVVGVVLLLVLVRWATTGAQGRKVLSELAGFATAMIAVALPWLIKSLVYTGNPVAPLFSDWIPNPNFTPEDYQTWLQTTRTWAGFSGGLLDYLRAPWLLTRQGNVFQGVSGPLFLGLLPLAMIASFRSKSIRLLLACSLVLGVLLLLGSRLVRYQVPVFPFLSLAIAGALVTITRRGESGRIARSVIVICAAAVAVAELPFFAPAWMNSRIQTIQAGSLQIFTSDRQREAYLAARLGGQDMLELYDYLNATVPKGQGVLALTVGYQALCDAPLYMLPNSSPATRVSTLLWDASLRSAGLSTVRLSLPHPRRARYWRLALSDRTMKWRADFYRPRFLYFDGGLPLEIGLFGLRRTRTAGTLTLNADLGAMRRVDRVQLWLETETEPGAREAVTDLAASSGGESWDAVPFDLTLVRPAASSPAVLGADLGRLGVSYLFYRELPEVPFLDPYFQAPDVMAVLDPVRTIGKYHIYRLRNFHAGANAPGP